MISEPWFGVVGPVDAEIWGFLLLPQDKFAKFSEFVEMDGEGVEASGLGI